MDLRSKLSGVEAQLCAVQQSLTLFASNASEQRVKVEDADSEKVDLGQMVELQSDRKLKEEVSLSRYC